MRVYAQLDHLPTWRRISARRSTDGVVSEFPRKLIACKLIGGHPSNGKICVAFAIAGVRLPEIATGAPEARRTDETLRDDRLPMDGNEFGDGIMQDRH